MEQYLVSVIGRKRRVYSRIYQRNNDRITKMVEHYRQMEMEKSAREGFKVTNVIDESPNEHVRVFRIEYEAIERYFIPTRDKFTCDRECALYHHRMGFEVQVWRGDRMVCTIERISY